MLSQIRSALAVSTVVAIPVCNEELHIEPCLRALDGQQDLAVGSLGILLLLNNCTDGTAARIFALASDLTCALRVVVRDEPAASAGWARRRAMDAAAAWIEEGRNDGVLLTTDADSRVPSDWVARNVRGIAAGADAVAGRLALDKVDAALLPAALHERGALEAEYEALLAEITARLDPTAGNPWPHHWCRSGASLAIDVPLVKPSQGEIAAPDCGEHRRQPCRMTHREIVSPDRHRERGDQKPRRLKGAHAIHRKGAIRIGARDRRGAARPLFERCPFDASRHFAGIDVGHRDRWGKAKGHAFATGPGRLRSQARR